MPHKNRDERLAYKKRYREKNAEIISQKKKECYERNKQQYLDNMKEYRENHKEEHKIYMEKYYQENREEHDKQSREWAKNNPEKIIEMGRKYYVENKEYVNERNNKWRENNPEKHKEIMRRSNTKRSRELGYNPLNEKFPGSVGHHINKNDVIYIPEELHRNIPHSQNDPVSMKMINIKAEEYLQEVFLSHSP